MEKSAPKFRASFENWPKTRLTKSQVQVGTHLLERTSKLQRVGRGNTPQQIPVPAKPSVWTLITVTYLYPIMCTSKWNTPILTQYQSYKPLRPGKVLATSRIKKAVRHCSDKRNMRNHRAHLSLLWQNSRDFGNIVFQTFKSVTSQPVFRGAGDFLISVHGKYINLNWSSTPGPVEQRTTWDILVHKILPNKLLLLKSRRK